jgi:molecular chaperone GrpE
MKSKKDKTEMKDSSSEMENVQADHEVKDAEVKTDAADAKQEEVQENELDKVKAQLEEKTKQCGDYYSALQRAAAEFDNYKKRTAREKEALYTEAVSDVAAAFLPVIDSIDRAVQACSRDSEAGSLKEGVELVCRQAKDVLKNLGVEEIKSVNEAFDPNLHNAVMHIEDENYGQGVVVEEFQKGYIYKEKVIRHSMVKVAN